MEMLTAKPVQSSSKSLTGYLFSIGLHVIIICIVVFFPDYGRKPMSFPDSIEVQLFDSMIGDIEPAGGNPSQEPPDVLDPPPPKEDIPDPSAAEIKRMKKRDEDRKPPPKKAGTDGTRFDMKNKFLGGKGSASGSMALDSENFPYVYYLAMLKNRISENWIPPFGIVNAGESKRVVVHFRIDRGGKVANLEVEESSGDESLDNSAMRSIIVSSPFPPLPDNYPEATLGVDFGFKCEM